MSVGVCFFLGVWSLSLDQEEIKKQIPDLYWSSIYLQIVMTIVVIKDVLV